MGTVAVSLPSDGETANVSDYNTPITTIVNEFNGNIDNANIKSGAAIATAKLADDGGITAAKIGNDAVTATKIDWASTGTDGGIWWEELDRETLSGTSSTISFTGLAERRYLKIICNVVKTATLVSSVRFNNDSGNNYAIRRELDGAADNTTTSTSSIEVSPNYANQANTIIQINNYGAEKLVIADCTANDATGAATAPHKARYAGKYVSATAITRIDFIVSTSTYAAGTEIVILGHN